MFQSWRHIVEEVCSQPKILILYEWFYEAQKPKLKNCSVKDIGVFNFWSLSGVLILATLVSLVICLVSRRKKEISPTVEKDDGKNVAYGTYMEGGPEYNIVIDKNSGYGR